MIIILIIIKYSLSPAGCVWMANYKCQCRRLQSLPSLWEFTELWAEPEPLTFCSEYKMLIHAAGNPELGERAVVLPSSLPQSLSLSSTSCLSPTPRTDCMHSYHGSLCSFSLSDTSPVYLLAATDPIHSPSPWPLPRMMNQNPSRPNSLHPRESI